MIILLNGASSSGKTSVARELQATWDGPLAYLALDTAIGMLPFHYTGDGALAREGFELFPYIEGGETMTGYRMGRFGRLLNGKLAGWTAELHAEGLDVVVDQVFIDAESLAPFVEALPTDQTYLVGVSCELEELERRERARGDRIRGVARFQHRRVHWPREHYDLELDSTVHTPVALAAAVHARVRAGDPPSGLRGLR